MLRNVPIEEDSFVWKLIPDSREGSPGYLPKCKWPARQYL